MPGGMTRRRSCHDDAGAQRGYSRPEPWQLWLVSDHANGCSVRGIRCSAIAWQIENAGTASLDQRLA